VNVTIGATLRKASVLLRLRRARNRDAMPVSRIDSEPLLGSCADAAYMLLSIFLINDAELPGDATRSARRQDETTHNGATAAECGDRQRQSAGKEQA
jgi:hypothetical protein